MTAAGVVIFEKVWFTDSESIQTEKKGRLFGSLITTMQEFSRQSTGGMIVTYLEFQQVAVSIVDDSKTKLLCTLFHDTEDGSDFGQMIAAQILRSFIESFPDISFQGTLNVATFSSFVGKLFDAIQNSVRAIVQQLQSQRGINSALVVYDNGQSVMTVAQEEDQLGIVANLTPIITLSTDILQAKTKERPELITLEMSKQIVIICRVGDASLVSICRKSTNPTHYQPAIERAAVMLEKVFSLERALSFKV